MRTIKWSIDRLDVGPGENVVRGVWYRITATEGETSVEQTGHVGLPAPTAAITPYASLTEDQILDWAKAAMDEGHADRLDAIMAATLDEALAQKTGPLPLPWQK
jgi:hypothetical protein